MSPKDEEALEHYQEITKRRMDEVWNPLSPCNVQLEILWGYIYHLFCINQVKIPLGIYWFQILTVKKFYYVGLCFKVVRSMVYVYDT